MAWRHHRGWIRSWLVGFKKSPAHCGLSAWVMVSGAPYIPYEIPEFRCLVKDRHVFNKASAEAGACDFFVFRSVACDWYLIQLADRGIFSVTIRTMLGSGAIPPAQELRKTALTPPCIDGWCHQCRSVQSHKSWPSCNLDSSAVYLMWYSQNDSEPWWG